MMMYRELFGFSVKNTFYRNEKYPSDFIFQEDFEIQPTPVSQVYMNQFGLVWRKYPNGFKVLAKVKRLTPTVMSMAHQLDTSAHLTFLISLKNQAIQSYADVAIKALSSGTIYYGHNKGINSDPRDDLRTSTQPTVNSDDDLLRTESSCYSYEMAGFWGLGSARIIAADGPEVLLPNAATQANGNTSFTFLLTSLPIGRYHLEIGGLVRDSFFYVGPNRHVFGAIAIFFDGTGENYRILESDFSLTPLRPHYIFRLQARKTFWRYTVNMVRNPLAAPAMEISDGSVLFIRNTPSPQRAIFTSDVGIDSREEPLLRGSPSSLIKINLSDGLIEKIEHLPLPNLALLKKENSKYYSDITINI